MRAFLSSRWSDIHGPGIVGASCAYHLAECGQRVVVVEARESAAWHAWFLTGQERLEIHAGTESCLRPVQHADAERSRDGICQAPEVLLGAPPKRLQVDLWGIDEAFHVPISMAALMGVLSTFLRDSMVNYVNAERLAQRLHPPMIIYAMLALFPAISVAISLYGLIDGQRGGHVYNFTKQWMYQDRRHGSIDQSGSWSVT